MKEVSRKELIRKFRSLGFAGPYSGGKHQFMVKGSKKVRIPNPHGQDINTGILKEILYQAGILVEEWEKV
jgi:predicted RNA binding protein YcfA (HicA-like mRNA interferase family)